MLHNMFLTLQSEKTETLEREKANTKILINMSILIGSLIGGAIAFAVVSFVVDLIDKCL